MSILKPTVQSLDEVDEAFHSLYEKQEDGSYRLSVLKDYTPNSDVEDTTGLKSALRKERENNSNYSKKIKSLEEKYAGFDLDEYNELLESKRQTEEEQAEKKGEWDRLKQQMLDSHRQELSAKDQIISRLKTEIERHLIDAEATAAINNANGNVKLLQPHVKSSVKLVEEDDGTFKAQVIGADGTPRVDGEGNPLTIEKLVSEMRDQDDFASAFAGSGQSGSGTPPGSGSEDLGNPGGNPGKPIPDGLTRSSMSNRQKVDFIREHGEDKFLALPG